MSKRVLVVNGHPDPRPERFCAALCDAYAGGAAAGGWTVDRIAVGLLDFPAPGDGIPAAVASALDTIRAADRLAIVFPLWLDGLPLSLQELFQMFAARHADREKPARVIATMDLPTFMQRTDGHGAVCALPGVQVYGPIYIGSLQSMSKAQREAWLARVRLLGKHDD